MRTTVTVSPRGQITLPAEVRRRLGIQPGGVVVLEEVETGIVLRPAVVLELEVYTDEDIASWDEQDALSTTERNAILSRLSAD
ncbi:MAG: AbrB/MazE/SpoVT family DNA-binding domain-containing protein [Thermoleophilia bacterium]